MFGARQSRVTLGVMPGRLSRSFRTLAVAGLIICRRCRMRAVTFSPLAAMAVAVAAAVKSGRPVVGSAFD